jgi:hypothetical protein
VVLARLDGACETQELENLLPQLVEMPIDWSTPMGQWSRGAVIELLRSMTTVIVERQLRNPYIEIAHFYRMPWMLRDEQRKESWTKRQIERTSKWDEKRKELKNEWHEKLTELTDNWKIDNKVQEALGELEKAREARWDKMVKEWTEWEVEFNGRRERELRALAEQIF